MFKWLFDRLLIILCLKGTVKLREGSLTVLLAVLCCAVLVLVTICVCVKTVMAARTAALEISLDTAALVPSIHRRFFFLPVLSFGNTDFTHLPPSNFSHILPICLLWDRNKNAVALNCCGSLSSSIKQIRPCSKGFQYTAIHCTNNEGDKVPQHLTVLETSATAQTEVNWKMNTAADRKCDTTCDQVVLVTPAPTQEKVWWLWGCEVWWQMRIIREIILR